MESKDGGDDVREFESLIDLPAKKKPHFSFSSWKRKHAHSQSRLSNKRPASAGVHEFVDTMDVDPPNISHKRKFEAYIGAYDNPRPPKTYRVSARVSGGLGSDPFSDQFDISSRLNKSRMYKRSRTQTAAVASTSSVNYQLAQRQIPLRGREYIATVKSAGTANGFLEKGSLLRPTDYGVFSWLGSIAKKFEEFKFNRLRFIYEPQCPTTTAGSVGLYFEGDPTHVRPANWNNFINTGANVHGAPWAKHVLDVPAHLFRSRRSYYTKSEFPDANGVTRISNQQAIPTDPLEYYPGIFGYVCVDVGTTDLSLGKIYLEYDIELKTQSTDGYTITSMTSGKLLSSEVADNSGVGYYCRGKAPFLGIVETIITGPPAGDGVISGPYSHAGDQYFDFVNDPTLSLGNGVGFYQAKQDLELLCSVTAGSMNNITALRLDTVRGGIYTGDLDCKTLIQDPTLTKIGYKQFYNVPSNLTGTALAHSALIKLEKGDLFRLHFTNNVSGLTSYNLVFTPTVFDVTL